MIFCFFGTFTLYFPTFCAIDPSIIMGDSTSQDGEQVEASGNKNFFMAVRLAVINTFWLVAWNMFFVHNIWDNPSH